MPAAPPAYIQAPPVVPHRFGLFTVASVVDAIGVREQSGVEWEPAGAGPATVAPVPCPSIPSGLDGTGVALAAATPFVVYAGVRCDTSAGHTYQELLARAQTRLSLGEQAACERALWSGEGGNRPRLAAPTTVVLASGAAVPLAAGVGLLEEYLVDTYAGIGALHAPRRVAPAAAAARLVDRDGARLVTTVGTPVVFGRYPATGPDGAAPPTGAAWLYATGQVLVRRGDVQVSDEAAGFAPATGRPLAVAQRVYLAGFEGTPAAVLIQLA